SLSACGQKGPLTHPPRKPATESPAPQAPATEDNGESESEEEIR
ncbi:MAG: lipoprotein, partial [Gammaproteobacteria bacterium]